MPDHAGPATVRSARRRRPDVPESTGMSGPGRWPLNRPDSAQWQMTAKTCGPPGSWEDRDDSGSLRNTQERHKGLFRNSSQPPWGLMHYPLGPYNWNKKKPRKKHVQPCTALYEVVGDRACAPGPGPSPAPRRRARRAGIRASVPATGPRRRGLVSAYFFAFSMAFLR